MRLRLSTPATCWMVLVSGHQAVLEAGSVWANRLAFPDPELVKNASFPSSSGTTQTGVVTGVESRRKVVNSTYFSSASVTPSAYRWPRV